MARAITYNMGRGLLVILRRRELNELTRHLKDHGKNLPNWEDEKKLSNVVYKDIMMLSPIIA
jgi:hypothetical protein